MTTPDKDEEEYKPAWWVKTIHSAEKDLDEKWRTSADSIVARYLDDRNNSQVDILDVTDAKKYNMFWANTQILKSALYATPPKPTVKRLHDDASDDVARVGALILQRIIGFGMLQDNSDMHRAFQNATEDRLIPGLGQVWLRLKTDTEKYTLPKIGNEPELQGERITSQEVCTDYVHWRDFCWSPARVWSEVWWVSRRVWMTRSRFIARFGKVAYDKYKDDITSTVTEKYGYPKGFAKNRIQVLEIWCKESKKAHWVQEDTEVMLEERDNPLKLRDFFPCPQPLLATHTTNSLIPRPDYVMVQDQYAELDQLNDRISTLTKALRVVGAYDSKNPDLAKMITGSEFTMIPVDSWAVLSEKGGIKGVVDWFPIEVVGKVLETLIEIRPRVIEQIYELTSISDIMRGATNPRETLGAQKLKAQYSSVRLRLTQEDVALFVSNAMKIKCEIISKHMDPEQIKKQSAIQYTNSAPMADRAIEFIKSIDPTDFRIEISEESLSMADYTAERELRIAYLTAVGQFLSQSSQMAAEMPGAIPYVIAMIQWVTASFRGSDDIETVLDEALAAVEKNPPGSQQEQAPPDHSMEVAQIKAQTDQTATQSTEKIAMAKGQADAGIAQAKIHADANTAQMKLASDERIAMAKIDLERENNIRDNETKLTIAGQEASLTMQQAEIDADAEEASKGQESEKMTSLVAPIVEHTKTVAEAMQQIAKPKKRVLKKDSGGNSYSEETT